MTTRKQTEASAENFDFRDFLPDGNRCKEGVSDPTEPPVGVTEEQKEVAPTADTPSEVLKEQEEAPAAHKPETAPSVARRVSSKQRKLSLDEYRATFLQVPRIVNRRPVFVSEEVRQQLDLIVLRLSETRRMSVTGLLENICRHHIETYKEDIEQWRKL